MMLLTPAAVISCVVILTSCAITSFGQSRRTGDIRCENPSRPVDGVFVWDASGEQSVIYKCRPGLVLVGSVSSVCVNGRWTEKAPLCLGRNCDRTAVKHATTIVQHGGALVQFQCRQDYKLTGSSQVLACVQGQWNGTFPECVAKSELTKSGHRQNIYNSPQQQQQQQHRTDRRQTAGRQTSNASRRQTDTHNEATEKKSHEEWLLEADYSCIRATGEQRTVDPPRVPNARFSTRWAMADGRPRLYTTYRCKWGFVRTGAANMYCRESVWVGTQPHCQQIKGIEADGSIQGDRAGPALNHHMSHNSLLRLADYTCATIAVPSIQHAQSTLLFTVLDDAKPHLYARYSCDGGYKLTNANYEYLYCRHGRWTGSLPNCVSDWSKSCSVNNGGCQHRCDTETGQSRCSCHHGYQLQDDQHSCTDIDECVINNGECDHICDNTAGSYRCACYTGYQLQHDHRSCYPTAHNNAM